jgi:hypothetical protein
MFQAVTLKATIDAAHVKLAAGKTVKDAIAGIPTSDRLGVGEASLSAHIKDPKKWGEHRAAWQRLAVEKMPGDVGNRVRAVAEADKGTALAMPVLKARVDAELAKNSTPDEQHIVTAAGRQNNPGESKYGESIWTTYQRPFPPATASPGP